MTEKKTVNNLIQGFDRYTCNKCTLQNQKSIYKILRVPKNQMKIFFELLDSFKTHHSEESHQFDIDGGASETNKQK